MPSRERAAFKVAIEPPGRACYIPVMTSDRMMSTRSGLGTSGVKAHSTIAFAAIGDHARLPSRFFARLFASDSSLLHR